MKKLVFSFLCLLLSNLSFAQTEQGRWLVGGGASFGSASSSLSSGSTTSIIIQPKIGYFLVDNFTLGASVPFGYSSSRTNITSTSVGIAPFIRYFFLKGNVKPFLEAEGGYNSTSSSNSSTSSSNTFFGVGGGLAIFLTKSAALDLSLNYRTYSYSPNSYTSNTFGLQVGFLVYLGGGNKE